MKRQPNSHRPNGFTLIEVLTVIAIVAMLAAMGFAGMRYAMDASRKKDCTVLIADITKAVQEYQAENGGYPRPASDEEQTVVDGETYKIAGARVLYQFLSGDGDDALQGGEKPSTGIQGSAQDEKKPGLGKIYMDTIQAPNKEEIEKKKTKKLVASASETSFYVIDPWRHPLQYQVPERDKNGLVTGEIETYSSSNFELWSYGSLKKPEATEAAQKEWITSWGAR